MAALSLRLFVVGYLYTEIPFFVLLVAVVVMAVQRIWG